MKKLKFIANMTCSLIFASCTSTDSLIDQYENLILNTNLNSLEKKKTSLLNLTDKMILLNPFNIMKKGYSIVYKDDCIISSSKNITSDDEIMIKMSDGNVFAKVK
jgi:exodeoxyribonuclease VII large subunit